MLRFEASSKEIKTNNRYNNGHSNKYSGTRSLLATTPISFTELDYLKEKNYYLKSLREATEPAAVV